MNIELAYKLRTLIGISRDLFYSEIWVYIPLPPKGEPPEYDVVEYDNFIGGAICCISNVQRHWFTFGNNVMLHVVPIERPMTGFTVCCLCEGVPTFTGTDTWYHHSGYNICHGCNELIKDDPDFF